MGWYMATLELALTKIYSVSDVSPAKDGSLIKKILDAAPAAESLKATEKVLSDNPIVESLKATDASRVRLRINSATDGTAQLPGGGAQ